MKYQISRVGTFAIMALAATACGQAPGGGGQGDVDMDSPEYQAMEYRQGLMHVMAFKAGKIRDMADGNIPVDEAVFAKSAADLVAAAGMIEDAFVPGSDSESIPGSNALPDIWSDPDGVRERIAALQGAAQTVAAQSRTGGFQAAQTAASEDIGPACGACHRTYRQRAD